MSAARRRLAVTAAMPLLLTVGACANENPETTAGESATGTVWVANEDAGSLTVLDAETGSVVATLSGIAGPHNVQATADGDAVLTVSSAGALVRIDAEELEVDDFARTGKHPAHVVDDPHGNIYVTTAVDRRVTRYTQDLRRDASVELVGSPHGLRLDAAGHTAVVANIGGGSLDVVDTALGEVVKRVRVGASPVQVAITPDGAGAFISVAATSEVVKVDLLSGEVEGRLTMPAAPAQILLTGDHLFVANQGTPERPGDTVSIVDADAFRVIGSVPTGSGPHGLTSDPDGERVWVTNAFDYTVTAFDVPSRAVLYTVDVGANPNGISFSTATPAPADQQPVPLMLPHRIAHPDDHGHDDLGHDDLGHSDLGHSDDGHGDHSH